MGMRICDRADKVAGWAGGYFGSYWVWDVRTGVRTQASGVADALNWGIWPLGCASTHLDPFTSPSSSSFSWILSSLSSLEFWFAIEGPTRRGDCLPPPGTGISEWMCWRWRRDYPGLTRDVWEVRERVGGTGSGGGGKEETGEEVNLVGPK